MEFRGRHSVAGDVEEQGSRQRYGAGIRTREIELPYKWSEKLILTNLFWEAFVGTQKDALQKK